MHRIESIGKDPALTTGLLIRRNPQHDVRNAMPNTGLFGPNDLTVQSIDANAPGMGPGAYALGRLAGGIFYVSYVGRSDGDLNGRLKQWVGKYSHFQHAFYPTSLAAFEKECHLFHDFGGTAVPDNKIHPARPQGTNWKCPVSGCTDLL